MLTPEVKSKVESLKRKTVVLYGMETHICVRQTAFDLLEDGYQVFIVVDAVSSMKQVDRNVGIKALSKAGAHLITF